MQQRHENTDRPDPNMKGFITANGKVAISSMADISSFGKNRRIVTPMRYASPDRSRVNSRDGSQISESRTGRGGRSISPCPS